MWKVFIFLSLFLLCCVFYPYVSFAKTIREVRASENQPVNIKTALGYSTILEFSSKPISAVLGDQDAFRLEFVGNSITVKPLLPHAKSNLFVFTEYERFSCTLKSGQASEVDYVVKLKAPVSQVAPENGPSATVAAQIKDPPTKKRVVGKRVSYSGFVLELAALTWIGGGGASRETLIFDFKLSSQLKPYVFSAHSIGIRQGGRFVDLESLYLESAKLLPGDAPVTGKAVVLTSNIVMSKPLNLVFAVPDPANRKKARRMEVILELKNYKRGK